MTLQTYLKSHKRNYLQARIMFGQLLEAIVFLHKNIICHRVNFKKRFWPQIYFLGHEV